MKTAKRLLALALAGVMTLALLTGCGDKPGDKPEDTLRAEALADIINTRYGKNITCEADPQLSEAAERYTQVSSEDGSTFLINKLKLGNYHSIGSEPHKALLKTIGIDPDTTNRSSSTLERTETRTIPSSRPSTSVTSTDRYCRNRIEILGTLPNSSHPATGSASEGGRMRMANSSSSSSWWATFRREADAPAAGR